MAGHGQFCSVARALEILGGRWTLLVVRELLCGSRRFNEIRRGIPRISRTVLAERLRELALAGAIVRVESAQGPEYALTDAGRELAEIVAGLGAWGQRWIPRQALEEDLDLDPLLVDMERRVRFDALPEEPVVARFEIDKNRPRFLLLRKSEAAVCTHNPGFPELRVRGPVGALAAWWRGDASFLAARRMGLSIEGPKPLVRAFPDWFERYLLAAIGPATGRRGRTLMPARKTAARAARR
ncbi:MAG: helix-turn-helix transcriptional regulator [Rhodospirillales bacterium]|nr:helix-turn-helix transcriptional regulator [Rhodospirillales bacterium]